MIKMIFKSKLSCPVVTCDACGGMIGDLTEGVAVFADVKDRRENDKIPVYHAHKMKCQEAVEVKIFKGAKTEYQPLGPHLYYLFANMDIGPDELKKLQQLHKQPS